MHESAAGRFEVSLQMQEEMGTGELSVVVPIGACAEMIAPQGWILSEGKERCRFVVGKRERA